MPEKNIKINRMDSKEDEAMGGSNSMRDNDSK